MLCILSFFVFAILGIFSASHRALAKKAWYCLVKKIQFKPCDINFNEELKGKLLGKLLFTHPSAARFLYKWIDVISVGFVIISIWSLLVVGKSTIYLLAYDTCNPYSEQGCSLAGDSCTINVTSMSFISSVKNGLVVDWTKLHASTFAEAITRIPNRFKTWDPADFLPSKPSYYTAYDSNQPLALEIVDPSCHFCAELYKNIKASKAYERYKLAYIAYPIPNSTGYRFPNSLVMTKYLEAAKSLPRIDGMSADWYLLDAIFTGSDEAGTTWQDKFNIVFTDDQARTQLETFLRQAGYSDEQIAMVRTAADSAEIQSAVDANRLIVEDRVKTIKIPTIMIGGRRFDRLIDADKLRSL